MILTIDCVDDFYRPATVKMNCANHSLKPNYIPKWHYVAVTEKDRIEQIKYRCPGPTCELCRIEREFNVNQTAAS